VTAVLVLIAITWLPIFELRGSIPYGILQPDPYHWGVVAGICILANIALGPVVYLFLDRGVHLFLRWNWFRRWYEHYVARTQQKMQRWTDRWGEWAVGLFIGVPLPGSGVYTGALAAHVIGLRFRQFMVSVVIGVILAAAVVTGVTLAGRETLPLLYRLFTKMVA